MESLTPHSYRAARALLGWSRDETAKIVEVSPNVLLLIDQDRPVSDATKQKLVAEFAAWGVELFGGKRPGARYTDGRAPAVGGKPWRVPPKAIS